MTSVQPIRTADFLNGIGVDTHIPYTDGGYANISNVIADLKYLGINQVRDGITNGEYGSAPLSSYISLAQAGIHFTVVRGGGTTTTADLSTEIGLLNQLNAAVPGSVVAVEGPNEINNWAVTFNGVGGEAGAVALQAQLDTMVHSDPALAGVKVDYFTGYGAGTSASNPDPSRTAGLADYDTQHPYARYGLAPAAWLAPQTTLTNEGAVKGPFVYTETGYSTYGTDSSVVNEDVQAKYTLDLLLDATKDGASKTYLYQLMDAYAPGSRQGDDGFGLFDPTGAPKTAAVAIHNLTTRLQDSGTNASTFATSAFDYALAGLPTTGNSLVIQKSDGTIVVAVWAEPEIWNDVTRAEVAAPSEAVTLTVPRSYAAINVYDPLAGTSALASYAQANGVSFTLTDHPVLIEFSPAPAAAAAAPTITAESYTHSHWVLSGTAAAGSTVTLYDGTARLGSALAGASGAWSFTTAETNASARASTVTATGAGAVSPASAPVFEGGAGNDAFSFASEAALTAATLINGGLGTDTVMLTSPATLSDADFAHLQSIEVLSLTGASSAAVGKAALAAGLTTVNLGAGDASLADSNSAGLTINAAALTAANTLTLTGSAPTIVKSLAGALSAAGQTGGLTLTATGSHAQSLTLGSGSAAIADSTAGGALTIDATALAATSALTLSGLAADSVTHLTGSLSATGLAGALNVVTGAGPVAIAAGSAKTSIDASAMTAGEALTLTGSHAATLIAGANVSAGGETGALTITAAGTATHVLKAGAANDVITAAYGGDTISGGGGADTINVTGHVAADRFSYSSIRDSLNSSIGSDALTGFHAGASGDLLDFSAISPTLKVAGPLPANAIAAHSIGWRYSGGEAMVYVNATAQALSITSASLLEVTLKGVSSGLSAANIVI